MLSLSPSELVLVMVGPCLIGALLAWCLRGHFESVRRLESARRRREFNARRRADSLYQSQQSTRRIRPSQLRSWANQIRHAEERQLFVRPDRRV